VFSDGQDLVERYTFRTAGGKELCDAATVILIDLTYAKEIAKKPVNEMSNIESWVVFFALGGDPKYSSVIAEITRAKEGIAVANETLLSISQSPEERARFRSRRIWLQDREHEQAVMRETLEELEKKDAELAYKDAEIANKDAELAGKDAELANNKAELAGKDAELANKDAEIANKKAEIADKDAEIAVLRAQLGMTQ